jgi:hypothetical protein
MIKRTVVSLEAKMEKITWGFGPASAYSVMLKVHSGTEAAAWVSIQDKHLKGVFVSKMTSLELEDLISQDRGAVSGSVQIYRRKSICPSFPPHCLR